MAVLSLPLAVSGAVCDLDGVLTNTARLHELAWATTMNAFLRERCRPREGDGRPFSHDDYRRHVDGLPREDGARAFLRARGLEAEQATVALLAARKDRPSRSSCRKLHLGLCREPWSSFGRSGPGESPSPWRPRAGTAAT